MAYTMQFHTQVLSAHMKLIQWRLDDVDVYHAKIKNISCKSRFNAPSMVSQALESKSTETPLYPSNIYFVFFFFLLLQKMVEWRRQYCLNSATLRNKANKAKSHLHCDTIAQIILKMPKLTISHVSDGHMDFNRLERTLHQMKLNKDLNTYKLEHCYNLPRR